MHWIDDETLKSWPDASPDLTPDHLSDREKQELDEAAAMVLLQVRLMELGLNTEE